MHIFSASGIMEKINLTRIFIIPKRNKKPDWNAIFTILEAFAINKPLPSVSQIAKDYKQDPFAILLSTLVSLRTKDAVTLSVSQKILQTHPTPYNFLEIEQKNLEQMLYPAAFFRNKANSLKKICSILVEQYGGEVPTRQEALLNLPGVGLKTANLVLSLAFNQPYVCVDTHVHRICNRTGWLTSTTPEQTTCLLEESLPLKNRIRINELLVLWGQEVCKPISPHCTQCTLTDHCIKRGVKHCR